MMVGLFCLLPIFSAHATNTNAFIFLLLTQFQCSPALLLMGVNTTETQVALNDSVQLLSMGIVPDSVGVSPKLLTSFKDFDDDDKRLDAAYRRQVSQVSCEVTICEHHLLPTC